MPSFLSKLFYLFISYFLLCINPRLLATDYVEKQTLMAKPCGQAAKSASSCQVVRTDSQALFELLAGDPKAQSLMLFAPQGQAKQKKQPRGSLQNVGGQVLSQFFEKLKISSKKAKRGSVKVVFTDFQSGVTKQDSVQEEGALDFLAEGEESDEFEEEPFLCLKESYFSNTGGEKTGESFQAGKASNSKCLVQTPQAENSLEEDWDDLREDS